MYLLLQGNLYFWLEDTDMTNTVVWINKLNCVLKKCKEWQVTNGNGDQETLQKKKKNITCSLYRAQFKTWHRCEKGHRWGQWNTGKNKDVVQRREDKDKK